MDLNRPAAQIDSMSVSRQLAEQADGPATLYRYYDKRNVLLYVGITSTGHARAAQHWRTAQWWTEAARATLNHYQRRSRAEQAEKRAILREHPVYNKHHSGRGRHWLRDSLRQLDWWFEDNPDRKFMAPEDFEDIVGLQVKTILKLVRDRDIPHVRLGGIVRFLAQDADFVVELLTAAPPSKRLDPERP